ncbi:MAG: phosphoglucosamine mutase [Bacteroidales bacterium]|nr:phosphoglucosamine mutase [Bacteroidales bacterium]
MALIKSISGIRGTIGGRPGEGLSPLDVVKFTSAYGTWLSRKKPGTRLRVVTGRDARSSGGMIASLVNATLRGLGIDVTDLGLATTPTVEVAVAGTNSDGGIIITASHNPAEWNALKLLNDKGEFLSASDGEDVLEIAGKEDFVFAPAAEAGSLSRDDSWNRKHIEAVLALELVNTDAIRSAGFSVAIDCVNSVGGIIIPELLNALGVKKVSGINTTADGNFAHNPEPLPQHLTQISDFVRSEKADVGFVVDPDVDRLAVICEDGSMFGEEYTLVAVSDYVLKHTPGSTVSNLSSTRALKDVTERYKCSYYSAPVGEVNVVEEMKRRNAVIGGEGNGGVIYPALHYGRDALVGIALFLSHLAVSRVKCTQLRKLYPDYVIAKKKINTRPGLDFGIIKNEIINRFRDYDVDERDGIRIENENGWVQVRKSNTEPVIRIYAEGRTLLEADNLADNVINIVKNL